MIVNSLSDANKHILSQITYGADKKPAVARKINSQYKSKRFQEEAKFLGFNYRIRSIPKIAEFMDKLRGAKIPCPETYEVGNDYIIEELIKGQRLDTILPKDSNHNVANKFLAQVMHAHKQGIVIGDRWGKNEFLAPNDNIVFIDFDLEYLTGFAKELELAETINGIAMFSQNKQVSLWLKKELNSDKIISNYDTKTIKNLLEKHTIFWGDPGGFLATVL